MGKAFQSEISYEKEPVSSQSVHPVVGASSVFLHRSLQSFHKFTVVFSQISKQTMVESSNRLHQGTAEQKHWAKPDETLRLLALQILQTEETRKAEE